MTLPASLTPPLSYVSKAPTFSNDTSRARAANASAPVDAMARMPGRDSARNRPVPVPSRMQSGDVSAFGDGKQPRPVDANRADASSMAAPESEALTLRRVLDIRARSGTAELVELPVPVTEILRISLGRPSADPLAGVNARSLYEGAQEMFSVTATSSSRQASAVQTLQAA